MPVSVSTSSVRTTEPIRPNSTKDVLNLLFIIYKEGFGKINLNYSKIRSKIIINLLKKKALTGLFLFCLKIGLKLL